MQIIPYDARYKQAFIQFNTDWITEHFGGLEPEDYEIFSHIEDDWAAAHGAKRIFLISNSKLKPALHIYEKYGFHEVILDDYEFDRGDIAFEKFIS